MNRSQEHELQTLFASARTAVPRRETVDAALERVPHRPDAARRSRGRGAAPATSRRIALACAALLLAFAGVGYAAAPPIRAAIDDASRTFAGWFGGDGTRTSPGRSATARDRLPDYMRDPAIASRVRVVAEAGGYQLLAVRRASGMIDFDLGNTGVGLGFEPTSLLDRDVRVLGPGAMRTADRHGHVPLFGVTSRPVATVELENRDGSRSPRTRSAGAFVLLAEPDRQPVAVIGRDAAGAVVERVRIDPDARDCPCIHWEQYRRR